MAFMTRFIRLSGAALLVAAAATLSACNIQISGQAEGRAADWNKDYTLAAGASIEIRNTNGLIEVEPSDSDKITITAERTARGRTDEDAKKAAEEIQITETVSASSLLLDAKTSLVGMMSGSNRQVKFRVRAPKGTVLTLSNTNGNIQIRDMTGDLRLDTTNGRIRGVNLSGSTRAESTNGEVDLDFASLGENGVIAETTNGRVVVTMPKTQKARLSVRVTNGGIDTDNLTLETSEQSRKRLTATVNGGGPEVRLETTNGGVSIRGK